MGANAGLAKPITWTIPDKLGLAVPYPEIADMITNPGGGCVLDGMPIPCAIRDTLAEAGGTANETRYHDEDGVWHRYQDATRSRGLGIVTTFAYEISDAGELDAEQLLLDLDPQNTYDPRADFRDYALQLSNNGQPDDCLKLALLAYKAGQVFPGNAINGLLAGLTERSGVTGESDPNFRVGVLRRDPHFGNSFGAGGFIPMFQDNPPGNQVRHFVGWFAAGAFLGPRAARRALYREEQTSTMNDPDVALGMQAINMGFDFSKTGDHKALAQAIWRDVCGRQGQLQLP